MSSVLLFGLLNAGAFFLFPIQYSIVFSSILSIPMDVISYCKQYMTRKAIQQKLECVAYDIIYYYGYAQIKWKRITDLFFDTESEFVNTNTNDEMYIEVIYNKEDQPVSVVYKEEGSDLYRIGNIHFFESENRPVQFLMFEVVLPNKQQEGGEEDQEEEDQQQENQEEEDQQRENQEEDLWEKEGEMREGEMREGEMREEEGKSNVEKIQQTNPEKEYRLLINLKRESYNYYAKGNVIDGNFMVYFLRRYYENYVEQYSDEEIRNAYFHVVTIDLKEYNCESIELLDNLWTCKENRIKV